MQVDPGALPTETSAPRDRQIDCHCADRRRIFGGLGEGVNCARWHATPPNFASILVAPGSGGFIRTTSNRSYAPSVIPWPYAQLLFAAPAQHPRRDAERPADFGNVQKGLILCQILEPSKDVSMPTSGLGLLVN